jgi:hypothetical protein
MGADFEPVMLKWDGAEYKIRPNDMMRALAKVESVITFAELFRFLNERQTVPVFTLAMAYGALLRHAGARVRDIDVARQLGADQDVIAGAVDTLVTLLAPPDAFQASAEGGVAGDAEAPLATPAS